MESLLEPLVHGHLVRNKAPHYVWLRLRYVSITFESRCFFRKDSWPRSLKQTLTILPQVILMHRRIRSHDVWFNSIAVAGEAPALAEAPAPAEAPSFFLLTMLMAPRDMVAYNA